ncbi:hypothetical protein ACHWQZ_G019146 [Mnemiopsis leidyi]
MPIFKKILKSQRGGKILIDQEGYLYNYLRETGKGSTWACRAKYKLNCYTRVYYCENSTSNHVEITVDHNHPPKLGEATTIELMRKLKNGAKDSYRMRRELLKQLKCNDGVELDQALPTLLTNKKTRKRRSKHSSSVSLMTEEEHQENIILDVDSNAPDISSTTDTQQEHEGMDAEDKLEDTYTREIEKTETSAAQTEQSMPLTEASSEEEETFFQTSTSETLTTRQTSVWTPPTYNTKPQLTRLAAPDSEPAGQPASHHISTANDNIIRTANPNSSSDKFDDLESQLDDSCGKILSKISQNSASLQRSVVSSIPEILMTTAELPQIVKTTSVSPKTTLMASSGLPQITMTTAGLSQIAMTTSLPQIVAALPVPTGKIVATVGQGSDNTLLAGQLVRLPETIISNDMLFKRMNESGCTVYIAPPALQNPYCRQCKTSFSSPEQMDEHFDSLKCCEMCKMAFCVPEHYEKHVELNHPDGNKSAWGTLCETCGRVFGVMFQLDSHRIKCSNRVSIRCPRCFYSFGFEGDLMRHKILHGSMVDVKCTDCERTFPTSLGLQNHQSRRSTVNSSSFKVPHRCPLCSKKFCLECDYLKHVVTHTDDKAEDTTNKPSEQISY